MKIRISYRPAWVSRTVAYAVSGAALLALMVFLFRAGTAAAVSCALVSLFFLLYPLWMAGSMLSRAIRRTGCLSVTSDGVENAVHPMAVVFFNLPVTVRLIPWSCIDSFRLDRTAGGQQLLLIPKDISDFPKGYSPFVRSLLEREQNRGRWGLRLDIRFSATPPEELLRLLQRELDAYRRRDYPSGWPEAIPPVAPEEND